MQNEQNHSTRTLRYIIARFFEGPVSVRALKSLAAFLCVAILICGSLFAVQLLLNGPHRVPRTEVDRNLMQAENKLAQSGDGFAQAEYLLALLDADKIEEARQYESGLKQKNSDFAPLLYARAKLAFSDTDNDKTALNLLSRAAELVDADSGEIARVIWSDYAAVLAEAKDYRGALDSAQKIIEIKPARSADYLRVGSYADQLGDYYIASRAYLMVLKFDPFNQHAADRIEELKNSQPDRFKAAKDELDSKLSKEGHEF